MIKSQSFLFYQYILIETSKLILCEQFNMCNTLSNLCQLILRLSLQSLQHTEHVQGELTELGLLGQIANNYHLLFVQKCIV